MREKVRISGLRYRVGGTKILRGVDAGLPDNSVSAIVGPSGAMDPLKLRRRIGMVFQLPALSGASVEEAVLYGPRLAGKRAEAGELCRRWASTPASRRGTRRRSPWASSNASP